MEEKKNPAQNEKELKDESLEQVSGGASYYFPISLPVGPMTVPNASPVIAGSAPVNPSPANPIPANDQQADYPFSIWEKFEFQSPPVNYEDFNQN